MNASIDRKMTLLTIVLFVGGLALVVVNAVVNNDPNWPAHLAFLFPVTITYLIVRQGRQESRRIENQLTVDKAIDNELSER
jgi:hypothetical protein